MSTVVEVLEKLRKRKCDKEFVYKDDKMTLPDYDKEYTPEDLTIIKTYRFEGDSNPDDSSVIYLLETSDGIIGYILDSYSPTSDHVEGYDNFVRKINMEDRDEQLIFDL